jgi:hypothetical protein
MLLIFIFRFTSLSPSKMRDESDWWRLARWRGGARFFGELVQL